MKKSWHPLLLKNQERVWLEEKKALEEKKKLDQLRKEKEEERQLQELQRLQEEQTGKKRQEKLDWMYATPATGSGTNQNELEDYLLGKKRVDKLLTGDENEKIGAAHKNFIATQYANTVRDTASKIREDPLLAIKQQEQAAYEALMTNPLRLREMQEKNGIKSKKDKKHKKDKKEKKHGKDKHRERSESPYDRRHRSRSVNDDLRRRRSRSPLPKRRDDEYPRRSDRDRYSSSRRGRSRSRSPGPSSSRRDRSRSPDYLREEDRLQIWPRSDESDDNSYGRRRSPSRDGYNRRPSPEKKRPHSPSRSSGRYEPPPSKRPRMSPPPPRRPASSSNSKSGSNAAEERAARLAAMSANASSMIDERRERLATLLAQEKAEAELEEQARAKSKGMGRFLDHEQKKVYGGVGGLEERIKRGKGQMVRESD